MTGSSLWLLPPPSHPLSSILKELITAKIPSHFPHLTSSPSLPPSFFEAHMTLTSEIPPSAYGSNPQAWLDSIPFPPAEQVKLRFGRIKSQDVFHRRCFVSVEYDGVKKVVAKAREHGVEGAGEEDKVDKWLEWWRNEYGAHVSLIYGDEKITEEVMKEIESVVQNAGVKLPEIDNKKGEWDGWEGGVVWLVPTDGPIKDWKPIATRQL
ncbi:putative cyclic phosphodiesterase [Cladorrhinum samala]|uniref:Cyclic phosphodiesterase n=1 Tax=Cladorrhinum samala TaxID=585594 RepID=A0AAV9H7C1_9PEZI|nr:putative cyclic phosphodiesterase [Cladorrhinum samala]